MSRVNRQHFAPIVSLVALAGVGFLLLHFVQAQPAAAFPMSGPPAPVYGSQGTAGQPTTCQPAFAAAQYVQTAPCQVAQPAVQYVPASTCQAGLPALPYAQPATCQVCSSATQSPSLRASTASGINIVVNPLHTPPGSGGGDPGSVNVTLNSGGPSPSVNLTVNGGSVNISVNDGGASPSINITVNSGGTAPSVTGQPVMQTSQSQQPQSQPPPQFQQPQSQQQAQSQPLPQFQ